MILSLLPAALLLTSTHRQAEAVDDGPGNFIWLTGMYVFSSQDIFAII